MREAIAIAAILGMLAAGAAAFAWPWLPHARGVPADVQRYAPVADGRARLLVRYGADGRVSSWDSENQEVLRTGRALAGELRPAERTALRRLFLRPGESELDDDALLERAASAALVRVTVRQLKPDGGVSTSTSLAVRSKRGEHLLALYDEARNRELVFEPALQTLPDDLSPGRAWAGRGKLAGTLDYSFRGRVVQAGRYPGAGTALPDCRRIESRLVLTLGADTVSDELHDGWLCAGEGEVQEEVRDPAGRITQRRVAKVAAGDAFPALPRSMPGGEPSPSDRTAFRLTRVGRLGRTTQASEATIRPVWIPGAPALLLAAGQGSDLTAYDAADPTGRVLWRFHPGGTVYSPPAYDPASGRLFFGATDKRLYALDARGLFLWSFPASDNIATRPAVAAGVVVFGSEDHLIYGVDAATGILRWRRPTAGPVVSSPAVAGDLAIIGSDDGTVYALEAATGRVRWRHALQDAVEAPVVVRDGVAYVAGRDQTVRALDARTGRALWRAEAGDPVRAAVAVGGRAVYVVGNDGRVRALDRRRGAWLWTSARDGYAGPVVVEGADVYAARTDGGVHRLAEDGSPAAEWHPAADPARGAGFPLGLAAGGGALWLADSRAAVWRLGPGTGGAESLSSAWVLQVSAPPFDLRLVTSTAVVDGKHLLLLDRQNHLYQLDAAAGTARHLAVVAPEDSVTLAEPVVAGETLLVGTGGTLRAVALPGGRPRWRFAGEGIAMHPAVVAGGTVLWTTQVTDDPAGPRGTLYALDLATGRPRWSAPFRGVGAVVVREGTVYVGAPAAALDLASGRVRWRAPGDETGVGTPALSADGAVLFAGTLSTRTDAGFLSARGAADGRARWRVPLGAGEAVHFLERIWPAGKVLVVPSLSGRVLALDAATGRERWRYTPDAPRLGAVTVEGGRVYMALQNGQVAVLDAADGRVVARFSDLEVNLGAYSYAQRPVVAGRRLIVPAGTALLGLELPLP